jgi:hypothetical protein
LLVVAVLEEIVEAVEAVADSEQRLDSVFHLLQT